MNEIQEIERPAAVVNAGSIAQPGTGRKVGASRPAASASTNASTATGRKPGPRAYSTKPDAIRKRKAAAAKKANSATGTNQGKSAAQTGQAQTRGTGSQTEAGASGMAEPLVDSPPPPLDVRIGGEGGETPKLALYPAVKQILQFGADMYAGSRPLIDPALPIPVVQQQGPDILQKLWTFTPEEIDLVAVPLCNMLPDLPPRYLAALEKSLNPLVLISGLAQVLAPRIRFEKELLAAVRQFNAGFAGGQPAAPGQPESGQNTSNPAPNGNGASTVWQGPPVGPGNGQQPG